MSGSDKSTTEWDVDNNPETVKAIVEVVISNPNIEFTVGPEIVEAINVSLQVVDVEGNDLAQQLAFLAWLSDTAGAAVTPTAPDGLVIGATGVIIVEHTAYTLIELLTDANGLLDLDITKTGPDTWYLNVRLPGGAIVTSAAITFA